MGLPTKSSILFWDILGFAFIARTPLPHDPDGRVRVEGRHHAGLLRHAGVGSGGSGEIWIYNICTWENIIYIYSMLYIYIYILCVWICMCIYIYIYWSIYIFMFTIKINQDSIHMYDMQNMCEVYPSITWHTWHTWLENIMSRWCRL